MPRLADSLMGGGVGGRHDDRPPIPAQFWEQILGFLRAGRTGHLTLHVHLGRVGALEVREFHRLPKLGPGFVERPS